MNLLPARTTAKRPCYLFAVRFSPDFKGLGPPGGIGNASPVETILACSISELQGSEKRSVPRRVKNPKTLFLDAIRKHLSQFVNVAAFAPARGQPYDPMTDAPEILF